MPDQATKETFQNSDLRFTCQDHGLTRLFLPTLAPLMEEGHTHYRFKTPVVKECRRGAVSSTGSVSPPGPFRQDEDLPEDRPQETASEYETKLVEANRRIQKLESDALVSERVLRMVLSNLHVFVGQNEELREMLNEQRQKVMLQTAVFEEANKQYILQLDEVSTQNQAQEQKLTALENLVNELESEKAELISELLEKEVDEARVFFSPEVLADGVNFVNMIHRYPGMVLQPPLSMDDSIYPLERFARCAFKKIQEEEESGSSEETTSHNEGDRWDSKYTYGTVDDLLRFFAHHARASVGARRRRRTSTGQQDLPGSPSVPTASNSASSQNNNHNDGGNVSVESNGPNGETDDEFSTSSDSLQSFLEYLAMRVRTGQPVGNM
ncbi:hypothetical protein GLAREA_04459 [Glarea lozoyensis ATCC 20868]|uniref:Uncharacterized protein n=1 Tax=Glarea lozoyensis (strain ATCC 20868 / MF5171) TaxID=1116229 RepID=S3DMC5_GLAL2|nr:uncharacterized protein GLAREA_04459 [Glarea lozoyensis ATCC 20868]EPE27668.1 hypothetical protein GLAREA_04459 [Glarea lozoyensis ATCC 20868]